jgi:hypothetical protein
MITAGDPDEGCTPYERTRRALHRSVDRICDVWPRAVDDVNSRGFPAGRGFDVVSRGSSDSTSVEAAALSPSPAALWLADTRDVLGRFVALAGSYPDAVNRRPASSSPAVWT